MCYLQRQVAVLASVRIQRYYHVKHGNWIGTVNRGTLEVVEFVARRNIVAAGRGPAHSVESDDIWSRLRLRHRTLTSCTAALASLGLHAFLMAPVLWAGGAPQHPLDAGDGALQWIMLDDSPASVTAAPKSAGSPALVAIGLSDVPLTVSTLPPDATNDKDAQADDHSSLGVMYGRYVGQIQARIERAWLRPRTSIGAPIFQCRVQIDQDGLGGVHEVTLLQCNGPTRWRLSLVHAVEAASPLPAPPNPAVFARHVILEFRSMAWSPAVSAELYEPPDAPAARIEPGEIAQESQNAFQALREAARAANSRKVIQLRIEGSKVEVGPERQ